MIRPHPDEGLLVITQCSGVGRRRARRRLLEGHTGASLCSVSDAKSSRTKSRLRRQHHEPKARHG